MKRYPFSAQKHAHDIELAYNTLRARIGGENDDPRDWAMFNKVRGLYLAVIDSCDGKTAWLTGKQYGDAKEIIAWAAERRAC